MKKLIILSSFAWCFQIAAFGQCTAYSSEQINQLQKDKTKGVLIPTDFSKANLIDLSPLASLTGHRIQHIDLVYTAFKEHQQFDQEQLNQNRIKMLQKACPAAKTDYPSWSWIEQTGAVTRAEAANYFHGFIIYYADDIEYADLQTFFHDSKNEFSTFSIDNAKGSVITFPSGTKIHVPANCVVAKNGEKVTGPFELNYREFRDPAQIALSGIPMDFQEKGTDYLFNSAGMYEIRVNQNGNELVLNTPITVDFNCTQKINGVAFYQLNEKTGAWKKEQAIDFPANQQPIKEQKTQPIQPNTNGQNNIQLKALMYDEQKMNEVEHQNMITTTYGPKQCVSKLSDISWDSYQAMKRFNSPILHKHVLQENAQTKELIITREGVDDVIKNIFHFAMLGDTLRTNTLPAIQPQIQPFVTGMTDAGHTFPNLVTGLKSSTFGIYNCDQQFRMKETVVLKGEMTDKKTGLTIDSAYVACVIDKKINGSFSFDPRFITLNPNSENVILVFTKDKKTYAINTKELAQMELKENPSFPLKMTEVTQQLKNSEDLKSFLGI